MQVALTLRTTLPLVVFAIVAGSAAWACFGDRGVLANRALLGERDARVLRIAQREETVEHLHSQIARMRDDPRVQERWVREELGLVRPGEVVFVFPEDRHADFALLGDRRLRPDKPTDAEEGVDDR